MMLTLYRLIAAPVMVFGLFMFSPFKRKLRQVLALKMQKRFPPSFSISPFWIHAASGEFEYAKAVIREIKRRDPSAPVIVTYSSPTYVKAIEGFPGVDFSLPLPLDLPGPCAAFLKKYKPRCGLIARTDLWPEILSQAQQRQIPIVLFSYTQRPPERMSWLARKTRAWMLQYISEIRCVTEEDAVHLKALGVQSPITVEGDTRYDQVRYRLSHPKELPLALQPRLPALVAGSTWKADEEVLLDALTPLLIAKRMQLILVPHEPDHSHIQALAGELEKRGLSHARFSSEKEWGDRDILLVDRIGVLAELYQWGTFAFVGGSYRGSVHSVMEPLGAGLITLVGPHHLNNREATEFAKISIGPFSAVHPCPNAESFKRTAELILEGDAATRKVEILKAFDSRLGASARLTAGIFDRKSAIRADGDPQNAVHN